MKKYTRIISELGLITQMVVSAVAPIFALVWLAQKLQAKYGIGRWLIAAAIILGLLIAFYSIANLVKQFIRQDKRYRKNDGEDNQDVSFNDHD